MRLFVTVALIFALMAIVVPVVGVGKSSVAELSVCDSLYGSYQIEEARSIGTVEVSELKCPIEMLAIAGLSWELHWRTLETLSDTIAAFEVAPGYEHPGFG